MLCHCHCFHCCVVQLLLLACVIKICFPFDVQTLTARMGSSISVMSTAVLIVSCNLPVLDPMLLCICSGSCLLTPPHIPGRLLAIAVICLIRGPKTTKSLLTAKSFVQYAPLHEGEAFHWRQSAYICLTVALSSYIVLFFSCAACGGEIHIVIDGGITSGPCHPLLHLLHYHLLNQDQHYILAQSQAISCTYGLFAAETHIYAVLSLLICCLMACLQLAFMHMPTLLCVPQATLNAMRWRR